MTANRLALMSLSFFVLTATAMVAFAQFNTSNPALSGNTVNPVLSGQSTLLPARTELSISPSIPTGLLSNTTGTNPLVELLRQARHSLKLQARRCTKRWECRSGR
jgi:hypothetical protein